MNGDIIHLWLRSDIENKDGTFGREEIEAEVVGDDRFRLAWTPLAVLGFACDDVIRADATAPSGYGVDRWGGRIGVQFLMVERPYADAAGVIDEALSVLGGCLEHFRRHSLAGSVPASAGHRATGALMDRMTHRFPGCEWMYANVYDLLDEERVMPFAVEYMER